MNKKLARLTALQKSLFTDKGWTTLLGGPKARASAQSCRSRPPQRANPHFGLTGGHFAAKKMYAALARHWWWDGMYRDTAQFTARCPQCAVVTGGSRQHRPPLHPIPVSRPFQIIGVDIMELPTTDQYVLVFQDFLTKWPKVYPMPDQKSLHIHVAELLINEVIPQCGVLESLLSDRETNLLSHLMTDVCWLLGIKKPQITLNATAWWNALTEP